jgi:hypothetical protein
MTAVWWRINKCRVRCSTKPLCCCGVASTPQEFAERIKWEIDKWAKVIRTAGIKVQ